MTRAPQFRRFRLALALATALTAAPLLAQQAQVAAVPDRIEAAAPSMEDQFRDPPNSARPRVWWHWMNGNISEDGIAKDMAWMKRVGIGGLQNFDANLQTPQIVDNRLVYMTPGWKHAFRFAATEADRQGLELAIAASPGWSETGGPWVPPEDGLKKLVWSETAIAGGKPFTGKLTAPPQVTGPFQGIAKQAGIDDLITGDTPREHAHHYADVAVLAYPVSTVRALALPQVRDGEGTVFDAASLFDGDLNAGIALTAPKNGGQPELIYSWAEPQTISSASLFAPGQATIFSGSAYAPVLQASDDGKTWRKVADLNLGTVPGTASFAPVTARHFRVLFEKGGPSKFSMGAPEEGASMADLFARYAAMGAAKIQITDLRLSGESRVDHFEAKAGFAIEDDYYALSRGLAETQGVDPARVVNLTGRLKADGGLDWSPPKLPKGQEWRVVRLGYSLLGTENHPAPPEATGLEVDKFDGAAVRRYMEHYLGMYRDAAGADLVGKRGVQAVLTDSIEVGAANWTPKMVEQFKRLRGYDPTPWLPALTGVLIGSRAQSDAFLYDYRRTLADLMASEHYGTVARVAREQNLRVYGEALENGRPSLGDDMAMRRFADIPMSAMWTHTRAEGPDPSHVVDMRGAASVAHIYGQNLVAAESMTSAMAPWAHSPRYLKRIIDLEFISGVNRPVIHTSVHQPRDDKFPGLSLFIFGQYFNRHESWAEMAKPWVDYLSRNGFMLQQGRNAADVAYFYGEEAPLTASMETGKLNDVPRTHAWDFVNADVLADAMVNDGNELVTPGGARYRALYLGGTSGRMTLATLRRIAALAEGGATVVGLKPEGSPSLKHDQAAFDALVARLWGGADRTAVGKGQVIASKDIEAALAGIGVASQFRYSGAQEGAKIPFLQRKLSDGESFFLVNQNDRSETIEARFRVTGKAPEIWRAETGKAEAVSYRIENGETVVPLTLGPDESFHVVFRKPAVADALAIKQLVPVERGRLEGAWTVSFQPGRGGPAAPVVLPALASLSDNADPAIKHFSGIASYTRDFATPKGWKAGQPLWIDLGAVNDLAEVLVNGQSAGTAWHAPYRIDVSALAKKGKNRIEVRVANTWVNRLIGDAALPEDKRLTWTAMPSYNADAKLRPAGLIGPVLLLGQ